MIAEAIIGRGDAAFDYYQRINPSAREDDQRGPPVRAVRVRADDRRPEAPTHGEAKNSWLTGTAAWNFVAITQWILGIRAELDGLRIDPVLPAAGPASPPPGASAARPTRSACATRPGSAAGSAS